MSYRRRYGNPDRNQQPIFDLVRDLPASVQNTTVVGDGFVDGVLGFQGLTVLVEIKKPGGKLEKNQEDFAKEWRGGPVLLADSGESLVRQLIDLDVRTPPVRGIGQRWGAKTAKQQEAVLQACMAEAKGLIVDEYDLPSLIRKLLAERK